MVGAPKSKIVCCAHDCENTFGNTSLSTLLDKTCILLDGNQGTESADSSTEAESQDLPVKDEGQDVQSEATEFSEHAEPPGVTETTSEEADLEQSTGPPFNLLIYIVTDEVKRFYHL